MNTGRDRMHFQMKSFGMVESRERYRNRNVISKQARVNQQTVYNREDNLRKQVNKHYSKTAK